MEFKNKIQRLFNKLSDGLNSNIITFNIPYSNTIIGTLFNKEHYNIILDPYGKYYIRRDRATKSYTLRKDSDVMEDIKNFIISDITLTVKRKYVGIGYIRDHLIKNFEGDRINEVKMNDKIIVIGDRIFDIEGNPLEK